MQDISPYRTPSHPAAPGLPGVLGDSLPDDSGAAQFRDYWLAILKHRWMVLGFFFSVVCLAVVAVLWQMPTYTAKTTIHIKNQSPDLTGVLETFAMGTKGLDSYETQLNLLRSRSLAARVIKELDLAQNLDFTSPVDNLFSWIQRNVRQSLIAVVQWLTELRVVKWIQEHVSPAGPEEEKVKTFDLGVHPDLIDRYLKMLSISPVEDSELVTVSFSSLSPSLSKEVINAHAANFIRTSLLTRFELTAEARQFLEEKLVELKSKVGKAEDAIQRFRRANGIVSLEKGENLVVERLMVLDRDLTQTRSRRIELESLHQVIQLRDNRLLSQIIDNPVIRQLKDQVDSLEMEQARLATKFKPTYPRMEELQEQVNQAKKRVEREVLRIVRTIESDYTAAKAKEDALAQAVEQAKQEALELREKSIEYAILEREVVSNRTLYENVLKKTKETDFAEDVPLSNIQVVDRAEMPVKSDDTHGMRTIFLSMCVGLLGGVGLAFIRNYLDNTLKTPEDVEHFLGLPTLGVVPDIKRLGKHAYGLPNGTKAALPWLPKGKNSKETALVISYHPLSLVAESYRVVRTAILFSRAEEPPRILLVTSALPGEGKTVTAINTALSLAQTGKGSVLLIDADLRNGRCHRLLGLQNGRGLTTVLTGNGAIDEVVKKTAINGLYFLSPGEVAPNPAELLGSDKMRRTLESLATKFSFLVIDSAPILPVVDTVILSTLVDGVILVTRGQQASPSMVRKARDRLEYVKAKILGVVLNGIDISSPEYREYRDTQAYYYTYGTVREGKEEGKSET